MAEPTSNALLQNPVSDTHGPGLVLDSAANGRPTWRTVLPLALVVAFSIVLRAGIVSIPLNRDEGEFAYVAQRWLAGDLPYRDALVERPPGIFVAYAALFAFGGESIQAIHWFGHAQFVGTVIFVYLIGRRLFSHLAGWMAALFTVVLVMDVTLLGNTANPELFAIFPLAAGMYFALRAADDGGFRDALLAGICGGLALCFKLATLPAVLFYMVWIVVPRGHSTRAVRNAVLSSGGPSSAATSPVLARPSWPRSVAPVVLGACAVLVPMCLYFVWHGAWPEFYECVVSQNLEATNFAPLPSYGTYWWDLFKMYSVVFGPILALALFAVRGAWVRGTAGFRACVWWWAALLLAIHVGGFYREQYFILIMPAVALLAAYGLESLVLVLEPKRKEWQGRMAAGLAVVASAWTVFVHSGIYWGPSPEQVCRLLYGSSPFPESIALGTLLRENSTPNDRIFVCGSEPQILFYSERASASRYIFVQPLSRASGDVAGRQKALLEELRRVRPRFLILVNPNVDPGTFRASSGSPIDLLDALSELLNTEYSQFAATTLNHTDGTIRTIRPVRDEDGESRFVPPQHEAITLQVWERRDAGEYTERQTSSEPVMNPWQNKLQKNLDGLRERIDRAARASGRTSDSVRLVAVTKQVDESVASALVELGVSDLGENRPQELWRKQQLVPGPVRWHLVGTLQKNKARRTLPLVHLIHSVDSATLLTKLNELAEELDLRPAVLLEVNVSGETTKHGFRPDELPQVIAAAVSLTRVQIHGLMTMAPFQEDPNRARPYFAMLRELRDRLAGQAPPHCRLTELSMGMSGDFEAAIAEGATWVRIGSALFEGIREPA